MNAFLHRAAIAFGVLRIVPMLAGILAPHGAHAQTPTRVVVSTIAGPPSGKLARPLEATLRLRGRFIGIEPRGAVIELKDVLLPGRLDSLLPDVEGYRTITVRPTHSKAEEIDQLIVVMGPGVPLPPVHETFHDFRVVARYEPRRFIVLESPRGIVAADLQDLIHDPRVEFVEPNYRYAVTDSEPDDADYKKPELWPFPTMHAPAAWGRVHECVVPIAVVDTGIEMDHPDLMNNVDASAGYPVENGTPNPRDADGHGTKVAGVIAAEGDNTDGTVGVCWKAKLIPIRAFANGQADVADLVPAIDHAVAKGAKVINASWSKQGAPSEELRLAIEDAGNHDVVFVVSSGNNGADCGDPSQAEYPAAYELDNMISVLSTGPDGRQLPNSGFGDQTIHLGAPQMQWSTVLKGKTWYFGGNSAAVPVVTGAVALTWSHPSCKNASAATIRKVLFEKAIKPGSNAPEDVLHCITGARVDLAFLADADIPECAGDER